MSTTINNQTERNALIRAMRQRTKQLEREGTYWTEDEKEQLKTLFNENVGITEISLTLQRTEVAVMQQIQLLDLYEKVRRTSGTKGRAGCLCGQCKSREACKRAALPESLSADTGRALARPLACEAGPGHEAHKKRPNLRKFRPNDAP